MVLDNVVGWGSGGDGGVCHSLAAGTETDGTVAGIYVQRYKSHLRIAHRLVAARRADNIIQHHRGWDYHHRHRAIRKGLISIRSYKIIKEFLTYQNKVFIIF